MSLLLDQFDRDVLEVRGDPRHVEVSGVGHDSREVRPGDVFFCLSGSSTDGHDHAPEAVARGAVGLVCERSLGASSVVTVRVGPRCARPAMAKAAAAVNEWPSKDLTVLGVTGTNGKTTVTHLLASVLEHAGRSITLIGTLSGKRTTPESPELQRTLARARDRQLESGRPGAVVMEVSSHALVQHRVDCIEFDVAVFTNLSHDHLDFHGTMDSYWKAKASLFVPGRAKLGVVSIDDRWGRRLRASAEIPITPVTRRDATELVVSPGRSSFVWRGHRIELPLTGLLNVENALLAAEAAVTVGIDPSLVAEALSHAAAVPGRLESVSAPTRSDDGPWVVVDYAHTPAALQAALIEARRLRTRRGRVLLVFGCGGERDTAKRPLMGSVAGRGADVTLLTNDNPRHEDPGSILEQIKEGFLARAREENCLIVEPDRRRAIGLAVALAEPGDVVLIAGKGHEAYQQIGDELLPFDDRAVASRALSTLRRA